AISRRDVLTGASVLAGTTLASAQAAKEPARDAAHRLKIIVTGGHPGDPEYGCGGTIARYARLGHEVVLLYLNRGERPDDPPERAGALRTTEATSACAILKARPLFAGQIDGKAIVDRPHYDDFRAIIEAERPDVVFTHW